MRVDESSSWSSSGSSSSSKLKVTMTMREMTNAFVWLTGGILIADAGGEDYSENGFDEYVSNHFHADERGGTGADAQGTAIADPRRFSRTAAACHRQRTRGFWQTGKRRPYAAPLSHRRLPGLL